MRVGCLGLMMMTGRRRAGMASRKGGSSMGCSCLTHLRQHQIGLTKGALNGNNLKTIVTISIETDLYTVYYTH